MRRDLCRVFNAAIRYARVFFVGFVIVGFIYISIPAYFGEYSFAIAVIDAMIEVPLVLLLISSIDWRGERMRKVKKVCSELLGISAFVDVAVLLYPTYGALAIAMPIAISIAHAIYRFEKLSRLARVAILIGTWLAISSLVILVMNTNGDAILQNFAKFLGVSSIT